MDLGKGGVRVYVLGNDESRRLFWVVERATHSTKLGFEF